ncbi:MAG TPA: AraC family transcriptional regulator [Pyrinomonadaceae bacterium]|jgi:AraC family transcriptional regulator
MSNNLKAGEFYGSVPNKRNLSALTLTEVVHARPISVPKHSHELAHFQLLLDGSYLENCGGKSVASRPMTISWHRPGIVHKDEIGTKGGRFFMIELHARAVRQMKEFARLPEDFYARRSPLVWLGCRLYHEFKNWQLCSDLVAEGISLEMLAFAARRRLSHEKKPPAWLARVVEKLTEEFTENFSTDELAAEAGVHPVHLAAVFRQFYRETMGEYVQKMRVAHASALLLDKELPLSEIAYAAGFSDQSHFTRIFKRLVGVTPGAFRGSLE